MNNIACVYWIENIINGKKYVGSTTNYNKRCIKHRCELKSGYHHNKNLQKEYDEYGANAFKYTILQKCSSEKELRDKEQDYIDQLIEKGEAYNISELSTSPSLPGSKNAMYGKVGYWKDKKMPEKARKNMSKGAKNKIFTKEHRENMSKSRKGKRTGKNNPMYGYEWSEEQLKRLKEASTGKSQSYEDKAKALFTRCKITPEDVIVIHHDIKEKSLKEVCDSRKYNLSYGMLHSIKNGYHWVIKDYLKNK